MCDYSGDVMSILSFCSIVSDVVRGFDGQSVSFALAAGSNGQVDIKR